MPGAGGGGIDSATLGRWPQAAAWAASTRRDAVGRPYVSVLGQNPVARSTGLESDVEAAFGAGNDGMEMRSAAGVDR